ncbi:MAG: RsiV family protein [Mycobacterium sp.]|uniref:esterase n=1 Tax=Mycobacterium sp. TaxID=1785 RepID=UPI00262CA5B7|nr:esterase [Mycobacterium sp.]MDI3314211.1 RsiV family protein [Mycobacterium sp.]
MRRLMATAAAAVLVVCRGEPVVAAPSGCASLGGIVESTTCRVHASTATYILNMSFPIDYPDEQALSDYLTQNRDGFVNVAQTSSGTRDLPYQMDVTSEQYRSGQPPRGTRSVVLKIFEDLGGPRPSTFYKAFNYDLDPPHPVSFDTLFAPGSKPLEAIYPIVQRELGRETGPGVTILPGAGMDPSHYQNFAITDDELIFFFAPGELLPPAAGATQVRVPRSAIPPLTV